MMNRSPIGKMMAEDLPSSKTFTPGMRVERRRLALQFSPVVPSAVEDSSSWRA
jgi:hypothetical protein